MSDKPKIYKVAPGRIATSRKDNLNYHEGQLIDLSHCTDEEIKSLKAIGLVVDPTADDLKKVSEVKNG